MKLRVLHQDLMKPGAAWCALCGHDRHPELELTVDLRAESAIIACHDGHACYQRRQANPGKVMEMADAGH